MLTISYSVEFDWYSVTSTVKDEDNNIVHVGLGTSNKERALKEFNYYTAANGFKGKRVNLL